MPLSKTSKALGLTIVVAFFVIIAIIILVIIFCAMPKKSSSANYEDLLVNQGIEHGEKELSFEGAIGNGKVVLDWTIVGKVVAYVNIVSFGGLVQSGSLNTSRRIIIKDIPKEIQPARKEFAVSSPVTVYDAQNKQSIPCMIKWMWKPDTVSLWIEAISLQPFSGFINIPTVSFSYPVK
jgi:hypothetical protein